MPKVGMENSELNFMTSCRKDIYLLNISVVSNDNVWGWEDSAVVTYDRFEYSDSNSLSAIWAAPKSSTASDKIYWGLYNISIDVLTNDNDFLFSRSFIVDLRDEDWGLTEGNYEKGVDTHIRVNPINSKVSFEADHFGGANEYSDSLEIYEGSMHSIWGLWDTGPPNQENFYYPVTFYNKIENSDSSFGELAFESSPIYSGSVVNFPFDESFLPKSGVNGYVVSTITSYIFFQNT